MGGEYAGGAASLRFFGRRVGVVVVNGFVNLLSDTDTAGDVLDEKDLVEEGIDDLDSFFRPNLFKLKGMVILEELLICEQNVGAGEIVMMNRLICEINK